MYFSNPIQDLCEITSQSSMETESVSSSSSTFEARPVPQGKPRETWDLASALALQAPPENCQDPPAFGRHKNWRFTSFWMDEPPKFDPSIHRYLCFGHEICPKTNKPHWQGYLELIRPRAFKSVMKTIGGLHNLHSRVFTCQKGADTNIKYCAKDGLFSEYGIPSCDSQQGARTDYHLALELNSLAECAIKFPGIFVKYHRGLEKLYQAKALERNKRPEGFRPEVFVFWGTDTGIGKSTLAEEAARDFLRENKLDDQNIYRLPPPTRGGEIWWQGYQGQQTIAIHEFCPDKWEVDYLFQLLDGFPIEVMYKGASIPFCGRRIVIDSHFDPDLWFKPERRRELDRRIKRSVHMHGKPRGSHTSAERFDLDVDTGVITRLPSLGDADNHNGNQPGTGRDSRRGSLPPREPNRLKENSLSASDLEEVLRDLGCL